MLPGEDAAAFQQLREDLYQDYLPALHTERLLFEHFVLCSWRLLRLRRVETETWSAYIIAIRRQNGAEHPPTQSESDRALAGALAEVPPTDLVNFFRYERMTTRDFYRALHELDAAQRGRRRSQPALATQSEPAPEPQTACAAVATSAPAESRLPDSGELSEFGIGTVPSTAALLLDSAPSAVSPAPFPPLPNPTPQPPERPTVE